MNTFDKAIDIYEYECNRSNVVRLSDVQKAKKEALKELKRKVEEDDMSDFGTMRNHWERIKVEVEKCFGSISSADSKSPRSDSERME